MANKNETNKEFYWKRTTNYEFKQIRKNAQHQYRFFQGIAPEKDHSDYTLWLGQITIYAGIANYDKKTFDKGISKFLKGVERSREKFKLMDEDKMVSRLTGVNEKRDKTKAKGEQTTMLIASESRKNDAKEWFEDFVKRKTIYYTEQMPIMYEDYWEGMKNFQEKKEKVKKGKKGRGKK